MFRALGLAQRANVLCGIGKKEAYPAFARGFAKEAKEKDTKAKKDVKVPKKTTGDVSPLSSYTSHAEYG